MKAKVAKAFLLAGSMAIIPVAAQEPSQDEALEQARETYDTRHAVFELLSFSNGQLRPMARGGEFDKEAAILAAERIAMHAGMIPEVFAIDTSAVEGLDTRALDAIWRSKEDFDRLARDLREAAVAAVATIREQGQPGVAGALQQIGTRCGACHDRYRLQE